MAEPYIAEIRAFSFGFPPQGWALCDGRSLPVQQNQALFSLLSYTFGGSGSNFNLPDLRGRVPVHPDYITGSIHLGTTKGTETVALTTTQIPAHTHTVSGENSLGNIINPTGQSTCLWSQPATPSSPPQPMAVNDYANTSQTTQYVQMDANLITNTGGGAHNNMQPYQTVNYCICLTGYYPPRP